jgi:hypothetical protein
MAWLVATLKEPRCARALRAAICGSKYKGLLLLRDRGFESVFLQRAVDLLHAVAQ